MITLTQMELEEIDGGNALETWGATAASDGLGYASGGNPVTSVAGIGLAIAGAAAYYSGWAISAWF